MLCPFDIYHNAVYERSGFCARGCHYKKIPQICIVKAAVVLRVNNIAEFPVKLVLKAEQIATIRFFNGDAVCVQVIAAYDSEYQQRKKYGECPPFGQCTLYEKVCDKCSKQH